MDKEYRFEKTNRSISFVILSAWLLFKTVFFAFKTKTAISIEIGTFGMHYSYSKSLKCRFKTLPMRLKD